MKSWLHILLGSVAIVVAALFLIHPSRCETIEYESRGSASATFLDDRGKAVVIADKRADNFRFCREVVLNALGKDRYSSITICPADSIDGISPIVLRDLVLIGEAAHLAPRMASSSVATYLLFPAGDPPRQKPLYPVGVLLSRSNPTGAWEQWCAENQMPCVKTDDTSVEAVAFELKKLQMEVLAKYRGKSTQPTQS